MLVSHSYITIIVISLQTHTVFLDLPKPWGAIAAAKLAIKVNQLLFIAHDKMLLYCSIIRIRGVGYVVILFYY